METVLVAVAAFVAGFVADRLISRGRADAVAGHVPQAAIEPPTPVEVAVPEIAAVHPVESAPQPKAVASELDAPVETPEPVAPELVAPPPSPPKRKPRETTVLVCGVGSNTRDEDLPANVLRCLTDLQRIVAGIIGDEGGSIDRFAGDHVIAMFTAKGRRTDHAGHALEAAQRIASNVGAVSRRLGYDLRVGVGVHSGALPVGDNGHIDETAIGDAIDVAARLEALASEAKVAVIVSQDVLDRAEDSANAFEAVGEMILPSDNAPHRVFAPRSRDGAVQLDLIDLRTAKTAVDQPPVTQ